LVAVSDVEKDMSITKEVTHSDRRVGLMQHYWPMEMDHNQQR